MNIHTLHNLQEAYLGVYELDEAEGSYGRTPKAREAFLKLYLKRYDTPSKEFRHRGGKTKAVDTARRHVARTDNPEAGHSGRQSPRPDDYTHRRGMTQTDRDAARQQRYYDDEGLDMYDGPDPRGPKGSLPKGKKLARQRKTGVSAESFDVYDIVLSHLLDEGYTDCLGSAEIILENMSDEWLDDILEAFVDPETGKAPSGRSPIENVSYHPKKSVR